VSPEPDTTAPLTELTPLSRDSLQHQAKQAIVRSILNGLFMPGERVVETKVAEGLNLSRSTVRAALQALIQEGLLEQESFKGTVVMPLTVRGAEELETIRESLEQLAVREAIRHATEDEVAELRVAYQRALAAAGSAQDVGLAYHLDLAMHQQIVAMAHHSLLSRHFALIEHKMLMYMAHAGGPHLSAEGFRRQHEDVVEGIATRDEARAMRGLERHFEEATSFLVGMFTHKDQSHG
jgi:DNA-binding GntR family transcriptional regulator